MDHSHKGHQRRGWPGWMRFLSGLGAIGVIVTGVCIATVPGFEVRHATLPKTAHGLALSGTMAIVVGVGVVLWGMAFLTFVYRPDSPVWRRRLSNRTDTADRLNDLTNDTERPPSTLERPR